MERNCVGPEPVCREAEPHGDSRPDYRFARVPVNERAVSGGGALLCRRSRRSRYSAAGAAGIV